MNRDKWGRDKEKYRKYMNNYMRKYYRRKFEKIIDMLGGKCVRCGITDKRVLQINHKNHDGILEIGHSGRRKFYASILSGKRPVDDLEVRCANCNILYEYETGRRGVFEK